MSIFFNYTLVFSMLHPLIKFAKSFPITSSILVICLINTLYTQKTEKANPYICDIRARIECEPLSEHSTRSDTFTNIRIGFFGFRLSVVSIYRLFRSRRIILLFILPLLSLHESSKYEGNNSYSDSCLKTED